MTLEFEGPIWYWRGPAPFYFVTVPPDGSAELREVQKRVTYGWGMIPATVRINAFEWTTALFPKDGNFIVPIKAIARKAAKLEVGDTVSIALTIEAEIP
jgi:Domain of unknown function (DUF1905)